MRISHIHQSVFLLLYSTQDAPELASENTPDIHGDLLSKYLPATFF
jgi:hypothetical protein